MAPACNLPTQEAKIWLETSRRQIVLQTLSQKNPSQKGLTEWLKQLEQLEHKRVLQTPV
jgi:arsenate reductase-like glutaredoxin family protein